MQCYYCCYEVSADFFSSNTLILSSQNLTLQRPKMLNSDWLIRLYACRVTVVVFQDSVQGRLNLEFAETDGLLPRHIIFYGYAILCSSAKQEVTQKVPESS